MELMTQEKKGFKRTEAGLIPKDWEVYNFAELFDFLKTGSLSRRDLNNEGDTYYIHYGDIHAKWKRILDFDNSVVPKVDAEKVRGLPTLEEGDLIIADASEDYEGVGASVEVKNLNGKRAVSGLHTILLRGKKDLIIDGLKAYLTHIESVRDRLKQVSTGTTVYGISKSKLKEVEIPLPPTLGEQQAIASALSDVDELIRSLDRLIQKKKAIKKGTMQQLLTGKKRLPGFDREWEEVKSGEVVEYINGRAYSKHEWEDTGIPVVRLQNLTGSGERYYYSNLNLPEKNYMYEGDLIFMWSASFGPYIWKGPKAIYHYHIWKIDCKEDKIDKMFYYHKLVRLTEELKQTTSGSTMLHLTKAGMEKFKLNLPPLEEQKAIAQILSDMDRELQTLRQKREKYKQVKQGMMQELLTGKTRFVKPESNEAESEEPKKKRSWAYEEAVIISTLIGHFNSETFFLSRFRFVKYSYLMKRFKEMEVKDYLKKAAGPYNPQTRYGGPERIAKDKGYIISTTSGKYNVFKTGENIEEATEYFKEWFGTEVLDWLEQFRYAKNDELELLTTVDLAMQDLRVASNHVNIHTVKKLINNNDDWRPKLKRKAFSDDRLKYAIQKLRQLFN